jgi:hypothetical protein
MNYPMGKARETLYKLKPVAFKYSGDEKGMTQYGVIAEQVADVAPDLVFRDKNGNAQTVRFEQISAMLLNEFLKEHHAALEVAPRGREIRKHYRRSRGNCDRTGCSNPEGERSTGTEQADTARGRQ